MRQVLVFGANGAIGVEIYNAFLKENYITTGTSRKISENLFTYDPFSKNYNVLPKGNYDAVCFAQGMNFNDSILDFNEDKNLEMYKANCLFILLAISGLMKNNSLNTGCKITIIGSIWQKVARSNKLSYCMTKAALNGVVSSLAVEIGSKSMLINAVLPGAIDNKMTRENLSEKQIQTLCELTPTQNLSTMKDISEMILFLSSEKNKNITNQFITIDGGFSGTKIF